MMPYHFSTIRALNMGVTYLPGSWDKRFARDLQGLGEYDLLTPRQIEQLERMAFRYRKQLGRIGFTVSIEVLEPYFERQRQQKTPDNIKNHWVKDTTQ